MKRFKEAFSEKVYKHYERLLQAEEWDKTAAIIEDRGTFLMCLPVFGHCHLIFKLSVVSLTSLHIHSNIIFSIKPVGHFNDIVPCPYYSLER
jgi:hypothetical protein